MSLVGSLEDLGLADILQIVSLAQKSGCLVLRSDAGDVGRILVRAGLVRGAGIKGQPDDLRMWLVDQGHITEQQSAEALEAVESDGLAPAAAISRVCEFDDTELERLRRLKTEHSVMRMFRWASGDFSFDVRDDFDPEDRDLELVEGINTQYLAMEASRCEDEGIDFDAQAPAEEFLAEDDESNGLDESEPSSDGAVASSAVDALALASARGVAETEEASGAEAESAADFDSSSADPSGFAEDAADRSESKFASRESLAIETPESPAAEQDEARADFETPALDDPCPVIAMDPDLSALEWLKAALAGSIHRVHIFQRAEPALERIRHYLARGVRPTVLISPEIGNSLDGDDASALVARLHGLAPSLSILALLPNGHGAQEDIPGACGEVRRPVVAGRDAEAWATFDGLAVRALDSIEGASVGSSGTRTVAAASDALAQVKALSQRLRVPQNEDILALVLDYAAESFERVAIFMVREDRVIGLATRGFTAAEAAAIEAVEWLCDDMPALFRRAFDARTGASGSLADAGNEGLTEALGACAGVSYVAPIESSSCVAALFYADSGQIPALADTTALDIVLHEAGLALDRVLLERSLASESSR